MSSSSAYLKKKSFLTYVKCFYSKIIGIIHFFPNSFSKSIKLEAFEPLFLITSVKSTLILTYYEFYETHRHYNYKKFLD